MSLLRVPAAIGVVLILGVLFVGNNRTEIVAKPPVVKDIEPANYDFMMPNESLKRSYAEQVPMVFVSRGANRKTWDPLKSFWNETTENSTDPKTGLPIKRNAIMIKLPLGINVPPQIPAENPLTLAKWELGKKLYHDTILSSDRSVSCATCHAPELGFTDQKKVSSGISGLKGGMNSPSVINSAFNRFQFWDGRAITLEDQSQGPVQNPVEMFDAKGHPWKAVVARVRQEPTYAKLFEAEFGHLATQDSIAKAIATFERTVIVGNSISDRAEVAMRERVTEEDSTNYTIKAKDYEGVLKAAITDKDAHALEALGLDPVKGLEKVPEVAKSLENGRILYFGKAKCSNCHVGESFTDGLFHNIGVGVVGGKLPTGAEGRFGSQRTGHKEPSQYGAFKTPMLRSLLVTKPYMHDGSETTLEAVVDFYDRGGNANEYLDPKMRDGEAEANYEKAMRSKQPWTGPKVELIASDGRPIIPLKLGLTPAEKKDLVLFLRSLESDPVDPKVADPKK